MWYAPDKDEEDDVMVLILAVVDREKLVRT
jgi:hypothetical protein